MNKILHRILENTSEVNQKYLEDRYALLVKKGRPGLYFFAMTISSAVITTMGFIMNSPSVIIGAMVISPLLYPIALIGSAIVRKESGEIISLAKMFMYGAVAVLFFSAFLSFIIPFEYTPEVQSRLITSPLQYVIVAVFSGIAGTFAYYWPNVSESVTGVGISVALMPPLVMLGVSVGNYDTSLLYKSLVIVALNIIGIIVGSALGYSFIKKYAKR
jgi:uncharacterized hydrophobic protein (TIGR00271 family)